MSAPSKRRNKADSITLSRVGLCLALALAALAPSGGRIAAATPSAAAPDEVQFTSSVNLVEVYASVVDGKGEPVRGLTAEDFEVLEDGVPQKISAFTAGEFPLTVALALDTSFSMAGKPLAIVKGAARAFLNALRPSDEAVLIGISSQVTVLAHAQTARPQQITALEHLSAWGTTPLYDAIVAAIETIDGARGRRALVILSDGDDRYSETSSGDALSRARRSNVMVFPVALGKTRPPFFAEIATVSGGRSFHARGLEGLEGTLKQVAVQLREQYLLGYSPTRPPTSGANEWRSISVRVKAPGVSVRARDGYFVK
jgi:Ca-activated chloride channel family protein